MVLNFLRGSVFPTGVEVFSIGAEIFFIGGEIFFIRDEVFPTGDDIVSSAKEDISSVNFAIFGLEGLTLDIAGSSGFFVIDFCFLFLLFDFSWLSCTV